MYYDIKTEKVEFISTYNSPVNNAKGSIQ